MAVKIFKNGKLVKVAGNYSSSEKKAFLMAHPIGSYFETDTPINPAEVYGGGWEKIEGRVLLGTSANYSVGSTGGSATHTLTINEMPSHTHTQNSHNHSFSGSAISGSFGIRGASNGASYMDQASYVDGTTFRKGTQGVSTYILTGTSKTYATGLSSITFNATPKGTTATNQNTGGGQAHNNMMPYRATNIWYRYA